MSLYKNCNIWRPQFYNDIKEYDNIQVLNIWGHEIYI